MILKQNVFRTMIAATLVSGSMLVSQSASAAIVPVTLTSGVTSTVNFNSSVASNIQHVGFFKLTELSNLTISYEDNFKTGEPKMVTSCFPVFTSGVFSISCGTFAGPPKVQGYDFGSLTLEDADESLIAASSTQAVGASNGSPFNYKSTYNFENLNPGTYAYLLNVTNYTEIAPGVANSASMSFLSTAIQKAPPSGPSAVPVPAAAWLLGSALLGFVGFGRKKRV
jgi:hypothetical protein